MRIASYFQLRARAKVRPGVASGGLLLAVLLAGCFFELEDLAVGIGGFGGGFGGAAATAGAAGAAGQGGTPNGGAAGSPPGPCPPGQKLCGDQQCRPIALQFGCGDTTACQACVAPPNTALECNSDSGECFVASCAPGFADCDGDVINDVGQIAGNGCEYSFGDVRDSTEELDVPFATVNIDLEDRERQDWNGVPAYALRELCLDCERDDLLPLITNETTLPASRDLDAYFRTAWDGDFFYVLGEVFDNHLFDDGVPDGNCGGGACEDGFSVFFDGLNNDNPDSFENDDHRVFLGLSERIHAPAQGQPGSAAAMRTARVGAACYRVEAQFDWKYITGILGGGDAPGQFPPLAGQDYGFDISINDWDPAVSDPAQIERQSQVFWVFPGDRYRFNAAGYGTMRLSGGPAAVP